MKKKSEIKSLSHLQLKAILELISPGNTLLSEIAKKIGVTPRTLNNWLRNQQFQNALSEAMAELKKNAISSSVFTCQIEALTNMLEHEAELIENFELKGTVVQLIEKQALLERKVREVGEELNNLRVVLSELRNELVDSGN
jgi:transcriptional regulator with XRE-family HTH domain